ncbi:MAG TPA: 3-oxoadipyl-CoA thiolase [Hyphomicrobiaceae bacterium]|nr:3-oxoadipyl-CoA thiolase [Hyphomicrobiaceae bacterium]
MLEAYIYAGARTPFGRQDGALSRVRPDDLLGDVIKSVVAKSGFSAQSVDDVNIGCAGQAGEDSRNVARHALLRAGLPIEVPGNTLNRLCGSGMNSLIAAAHAITCGEADVVVAGGVESMTRAPFVIGRTEGAFPKSVQWFNSSLGARFPNPRIEADFGGDTMPQTADNMARDFQLTREACDSFALGSQQKFAAAQKAGFFKDEILAVSIPAAKKGAPDTVVDADEHPRPETTMDILGKLRPIFKDGVTTAGNASGINDGAAALLIASRDAGDKAGVKPRGRILSTGVAGVAPRIMGYGPVPAAQKALERAGLDLKDMDVIEVNEAFAAQVLGCLKGLNVAFDDTRVNPNGGAIAVGHPLGASGSRIALTALRQLERTGGKYALISMCIGVGQGIAMIIERT